MKTLIVYSTTHGCTEKTAKELMEYLERDVLIVQKVSHVKLSTSKIDHEAIRNFSKRMDRIFNPFLFLA